MTGVMAARWIMLAGQGAAGFTFRRHSKLGTSAALPACLILLKMEGQNLPIEQQQAPTHTCIMMRQRAMSVI